MRVADEDRQLTAKELERLIVENTKQGQYWDSDLSELSTRNVDTKKLKEFLKQAGLKWDNTKNALEKLYLIKKKNQICNAGELFFSKIPTLTLRCAVFGGIDSANIIDQHDFQGSILELIEEAEKYVLKNINIGMKVEGLYRKDIPEISTEAVREAIINAFCHRDYRIVDEIRVAIFKDRVEIRSPGGLYNGLTIRQIRKGNVSKRRNPLIADLLRRIHMVEAWGRGMSLILKEEPRAKFKDVADQFSTVFLRPSFSKKAGIATQENATETPKKHQRNDISTTSGNAGTISKRTGPKNGHDRKQHQTPYS